MAQLPRCTPTIFQVNAFYKFIGGTIVAQLRQCRCVTGQAKPSIAARLLEAVDVPDRDYVDGLIAIYELNWIELARDVFLWAYERSSQRYTVVRDELPQPDPIRLRNREQLIAIVNTIVRDDLPIEDATVHRLAAPIATPGDIEPLIALALAELHGLHEGVLARFRLRLSEFRRWRGRALSASDE
jgi:hypothetical protein